MGKFSRELENNVGEPDSSSILKQCDLVSSIPQFRHEPFMCDECGKTFVFAEILKTHLEDFSTYPKKPLFVSNAEIF